MASETDPIAPRTWVAIDIAKGVNVVLVEHSDGRQQRFRFAHQRDDYDRLVAFLRACASPCRIALEPTADYHRTVAYRLVSEGFDLVLVSSVAGARLREAIFNSWDKNDPKDAQVIMRLLKQGMTQRYCDPVITQTHDLQELSKTFLHISRARTRLQHVFLTHYLTLYFPELERFWTTQRNEWFIQLLILFPTPASITAVGLSRFREAIWKPMGRRVHKEAKIAEIYALAERSIALPMSASSPAVTTFRVQLERYLKLSEAKSSMERQADELLADRADFQCLKTIPGIGSVIALVILAEAGDLKRFPHVFASRCQWQREPGYCSSASRLAFELSTLSDRMIPGHLVLQHRLREQLLQSPVLRLKRLEPLGIRYNPCHRTCLAKDKSSRLRTHTCGTAPSPAHPYPPLSETR
jgi:transposase